jgi:hypothetical protein
MKLGNLTTALLFLLSTGAAAAAGGAPTIAIAIPGDGATVSLGTDPEKSVEIALTVANFTIKPQGQCGGVADCGHIHLKIDPVDDSCNAPGSMGNSTNAATGTTRIKANFGYCPTPQGRHVVGVLLAHDDHSPVLVEGKPVTAVVAVTAR